MDSENGNPAGRTEDQTPFEDLLVGLSSRFINLEPGGADREIEDALERVCGLLGVDVALLWQWSASAPDVIEPTHGYPARKGQFDPLDQEAFPWVVQQMRAGRVVAVSRMDELPAEAATDRENARRTGIRSNLTLPLSVGGGPPLGALALNTLREERGWPDPLVKRLQLVGQVFTHALARKRADQALRESEELSRATFDQAALGIAHVGIDGSWLRVNDKLCAIVGYTREELLGSLTFQDITHPADLEADLEAVRQILSGAIKTYSTEKRYFRKDRSVVWVNLTVSLVREADGQPRHFISIVEDITPRKIGEESLRLSEARLQAAADLAGLGFYEVDFTDRSAYFDDRLRDVLGVPADIGGGLQPLEFWMAHIHPDDRERILDKRRHLHEGTMKSLSEEYHFLNPVRGEIWIHHVARVSARDAGGHAARAYGVLRDVTERKKGEEALKQSYAEIERLKDRLQAESDYLKAEIKEASQQREITGRSPAILKVLRQAEQVAPTGSSVLIFGETGTGKELLAQAIHRLSPRGRHVMMKVNCAALPSGLVESELFGREKGAFTGALTRQVGRFEVADGSTIFLDEVGELPADVQVKLLRVLQEGEFERLGSPRTVKVNVRVIAASNRDLSDEVRKGRFREDLYYRLNVFPIRMPPLRDRQQDIPLLVWDFLADFSGRMGKKITQVPRATMDALQRRQWPGNVRELRNVIEHGAIITRGETLELPELGEAGAAAPPLQTLADAEREHILRVLDSTGWRIKGPRGAAAALGLNPATLYSRLKKLGVKTRRQAEDLAT
jgi:formate hydrogenlyase transcriptional activator